MQGYEKVNKRTAERRVTESPRVGGHRTTTSSKKRRKARRRLVDLRALAAESPRESVARENEIVAQFLLADDFADRPAQPYIAQEPHGLVGPEVIRAI